VGSPTSDSGDWGNYVGSPTSDSVSWYVMKIFLDTADYAAIKEWSTTGVLDGVTTNPTHLSKEGKNPTERILEICSLLPDGVISVEVVETDPDAVYKQARAIFDLADNIAVKIPCHKDYYAVIKRLVQEKVPLNITLVFSLAQGLMMSKLGVDYISPFVGRLDDSGSDGMELIVQLRCMLNRYQFSTQLLAASIRDVAHFANSVLAGADVATVPVEVLEKVVKHPLTDKGMVQFIEDWKKLGIKQFP
jgi:transaldolase